jgi:hypothetical protein
LFDSWRAQDVAELRAQQCARCYQVLRVNRITLQIFAAESQQEVFRDDMFEHMVTELSYLRDGTLEVSNQSVNYALDGRRRAVRSDVRVLPGHGTGWGRVMVSVQDETERVNCWLTANAMHAACLRCHWCLFG